jgi:hypothetical protein
VPPALAERGLRKEAEQLARCEDYRSRIIVNALVWAVHLAEVKTKKACKSKRPPWSVEGPARCAGFARVLRDAGLREARAEWFHKQLCVRPRSARIDDSYTD